MPASAAAVPVPLALAAVPEPSLLASAGPTASAFVAAVRAAVSTEPSVSVMMSAVADAEPLPTEFATTSALAEDDADTFPSEPVLMVESDVSAEALPLMAPPPEVERPMEERARENERVEVSSGNVLDSASAAAKP